MDTIADIIIRIKNAYHAGKSLVAVPYSKMALSIGEILIREGFIVSVRQKDRKNIKVIDIGLFESVHRRPRVSGVMRISKPSRRTYMSARDIHPVKQGAGRLIISTPKGILTGEEAKRAGVGGEPLFSIW